MLNDLMVNRWDENLEGEFRQIYSDLNGAKGDRGKIVPRGRQVTPEDFGYRGSDIHREYQIEALRAALTDPNYAKTVAPRVAARLRERLRTSPMTKGTIRLNSIEPPMGTRAPV